ncbi:hypothetical protein B0H13DRAFT_1889227 [Mycena leptocephala]|nr:hypothetical protein B0H13DRAFT_1889227 [Mycena leptocephala]
MYTPLPTAQSVPTLPRPFGSDSTNISSLGHAYSDSFTPDFDSFTPDTPSKRKKASEPDSPPHQDSKRQKNVHETSDKLDKIFDVLNEVEWTLGDFLHHVFAHKDVHRSKRHATIVQRYLSGKGSQRIGGILEAWLTSPDDAGYDQEDSLYSTSTPYTEIQHARATLTSFAAQLVKIKLVKDMKTAVKVTGGMHAPTEHKLAPEGSGKFAELATSLMDNMKTVIESTQRLLYDYRTMPSINTIKSGLRGFSAQKAIRIKSMGRDTAVVEVNGRQMVKANIIIFDNSQHFRRQRERRIGRENMMVIGISATFMQRLVAVNALDPLDKQCRLSLNLRRTMMVDVILNGIDFPHLRQVGILQFIQAIATYIPEGAIYKPEIILRYRTRCQKRQLPLEVTDVHPLACSDKNETYIPELKDAMLDFLDQTSQTGQRYDNRLWFAGGDGMSYNNLLLAWHTMWTDLCRIHETHWGAPLNDNPASLGNSAKKIGRPAPANLKNVDYYPAADLLALVHDTRMLDCWRIYFKCDDIHKYFADRAALKNLPSFEEMEAGAKYLYDTYTSTIAQKEAAQDARDGQSSWADKVPVGTPWALLPIDATSACAPKKKRRRKTKKAESGVVPKPTVTLPPPPPFFGDQVISDEAGFMRDASISREVSAAVAVGDVGRMWEGMKVMFINFTGSGHSRYSGYLLEMVVDLELESSPDLRDAQLDSMERMNRELEPIIQRKDTTYDSDHIRNMWARNIKDIYDIKAEMRESSGLAKRSGRHNVETHPHSKPEVRTLLRHYKDVELHQRRAGRTYAMGEVADVDDFSAGLKKLAEGGLSRWIRRSTMEKNTGGAAKGDEDEEPEMTLGLIHAFGGEVVIDIVDGDEGLGYQPDEADAE